jgi:hypothetical protein
MHHPKCLCHFLSVSWNLCSVRVFSTDCDSASITPVEPFSFIFNQGNRESRVGGGRQSCCFWSEVPWWERKCEMMRFHDATATPFVAKVQIKVLHLYTVTIKRHSSIHNWLSDLPGWILCEDPLDVKENDEHALDFALHRSHFFKSWWVWICLSNTRVWLMLCSLNACLIFARVTIVLLPRFAWNLIHQARYTTPYKSI